MNYLKLCIEQPSRAVPILLMAAWLYYKADANVYQSPMDDTEYDQIARLCAQRWNEIEHHHKSLLQLDEGANVVSMFDVENYPTIVIHAAQQWSKGLWTD